MEKESHTGSIAKGVAWRIIAFATTMGLVYVFTGELVRMAEVGALEVVAELTSTSHL